LSIHSQFTAEELEAIREATRRAERQTGGELVCVIVQQSDIYESSAWKAAAFGALGGTVLAGLWFTFTNIWVGTALPWILLPAVIGAALGTLLVWAIPSFRRALIAPRVMELRVDRRAGIAFLEEEIFATRERIGVLIFVSLFEHGIRILRDKGLEECVPDEAWQPILDALCTGLKVGPKGPAIATAVEATGQLLLDHGVTRDPDAENELLDEPRLYNE
jgi:putative membrane protein